MNQCQQAIFKIRDSTFSLTIKKVYTQVVNGKFEVDFVFDKAVEGVRRGQSLSIRLALNEEKQSVLISKHTFSQIIH